MINSGAYANVAKRFPRLLTLDNDGLIRGETTKAAPLSEFRFSPNPNQAHLVNWQPWGPAAFAQAQESDKPVLLSISAVWCYWCHVMDETSYSDPEVQDLLNEHFIPVRVDNDHRPDINARYNVGGWPTTAFLTAHGGLIGGATYLPPDQLIAMIAEFIDAYKNDRTTLYTQGRDLLNRRKEQALRAVAGPELEASVVDRVPHRRRLLRFRQRRVRH